MLTGLAALALLTPALAAASQVTFGSSMTTTPTLDTANGASSGTNDEPLSSYDPSAPNPDEAISTSSSPGCTRQYGGNPPISCTPWMHSGSDNTVWNTQVAGGSAGAPNDGQILQISVKGCAVKDPSAPAQVSGNVPVNLVEFQTLASQGGGAYKADAPTAGGPNGNPFKLPFCGDQPSATNTAAQYTVPNGTVGTSSVTVFQPLHLCVHQGDTIGFYDIGGFIPNNSGASWYPQGVPFLIMAPVGGSSTSSFTDADIANGVYAPGSQPRGNNSGFGSESNQELLLQSIEGVGDDAYGLCPGGNAEEPANSNQVICVGHSTNPGDPYGTCDAQGQPVFAPVSTSAPGIAASNNGGLVTAPLHQGYRLDERHGGWTNNPDNWAYQWLDCDAAGNNCVPIPAPNGTRGFYYMQPSDIGHTIRVQEFAGNKANTESAVSGPTALVTPLPPPPAPVITKLKLNPPAFLATRGMTITYNDSETASNTIKVLNRAGRVVKTLTHTDSGNGNGNGVHLKGKGLKPGTYTLQLVPTFAGQTGPAVTARFTVKAPPHKKRKKHKPPKKHRHH